ncbi:Gfo/Idh/MocA family protein [Paenibacillus mesophilus]|uniref:Gfo/Idh/MocA family protein n=1 Tax=Paenibacillus mesophilus TaxID=2582849 RepID=UPI001EE40A07|nr:Gfo/Idh/MocA family oxidoreductase [Paenibacillus mesophilus]
MRTVRAGIIGIGGYGTNHVKAMLDLVKEGLLEVVAFAEVRAEAYAEEYRQLVTCGAAHYTDYERMLNEHPEMDFVVIATPIAAHKPMCIRAMQLGFHVLVEKPPAVTVQDVDEIIAAGRANRRLCQVNFQHTSSRAFRELLQQLRAGAIGRLVDVTGVGMWRRGRSYYDRTRWAGKLILDGVYVLDGTFNNPLAHLLNNCLLAAGSGDASRGEHRSVQAELYHVNEIEGDDVSCIRVNAANGVVVHFYAMLSHDKDETPYLTVRGTEGEASWNYENEWTIRSRDGERSFSYGPENLLRHMYLNLMQAIGGDGGEPLFSPIEASRGFILVSNGAYESSRIVRAIPAPFVEERDVNGSAFRLLPGLSLVMKDVADKRQLYSEYGLPWAVLTLPYRMEGYSRFELPR